MLDTYPDIRCDLSNYSFVLDALLNRYSLELVERIVQKTADIDRPYSLFIPAGRKNRMDGKPMPILMSAARR
nr:hypothetical protein PJ912_06740 [Pectobacterium colocasium]